MSFFSFWSIFYWLSYLLQFSVHWYIQSTNESIGCCSTSSCYSSWEWCSCFTSSADAAPEDTQTAKFLPGTTMLCLWSECNFLSFAMYFKSWIQITYFVVDVSSSELVPLEVSFRLAFFENVCYSATGMLISPFSCGWLYAFYVS